MAINAEITLGPDWVLITSEDVTVGVVQNRGHHAVRVVPLAGTVLPPAAAVGIDLYSGDAIAVAELFAALPPAGASRIAARVLGPPGATQQITISAD